MENECLQTRWSDSVTLKSGGEEARGGEEAGGVMRSDGE